MEKNAFEDDVCERVIPTGNVELMFHYRTSFKVKRSDNSTFKQSDSFISGISNSYADVTTHGETGMICVTFYPYGACNFFNFPLLEIENQNISLDRIFGSVSNEINEQLYEAKTLNERITVIENFLLAKLSRSFNRDSSFIKSGIELIDKNKGQISTLLLSEKLCVTSKTLERKFSSLVGKTPKQFMKIVRFQNILNTFSTERNPILNEIAFNNGYFDQAHFIKDFKSFSGLTPGDYFTNHQCQSDYFSR